MTHTLTTTLRLADGSTREIVIERAYDSSEWQAVTIDGMVAAHWLDMNALQCGKGETSNRAEQQRRNSNTTRKGATCN